MEEITQQVSRHAEKMLSPSAQSVESKMAAKTTAATAPKERTVQLPP